MIDLVKQDTHCWGTAEPHKDTALEKSVSKIVVYEECYRQGPFQRKLEHVCHVARKISFWFIRYCWDLLSRLWRHCSHWNDGEGNYPKKKPSFSDSWSIIIHSTSDHLAGWWFGTWLLFFPSYWECHYPNWRTPWFFRGLGQPPTRKVTNIITNT